MDIRDERKDVPCVQDVYSQLVGSVLYGSHFFVGNGFISKVIVGHMAFRRLPNG